MGSPANPAVDKFGRTIPKVDYEPAGKSQFVSFQLQQVTPSSPLYLRNDEQIQIIVWNSVPGMVIRVGGRFIRLTGEIVEFEQSFTPTSARAQSIFFLSLSEGFLISIQVQPSGALPFKGQIYCLVRVITGGIGVSTLGECLASGYISGDVFPSWPNGIFERSTEGTGFLRSVLLANPGAGVDWTATVPTGARWRLYAIHAQLVTSAAAGNRQPRLTIDDGTTLFALVSGVATQAASLTSGYTWYQGAPAEVSNSSQVVNPLPQNMLLGPGFRISSNTAGILAADQWSSIDLLVEEFINCT